MKVAIGLDCDGFLKCPLISRVILRNKKENLNTDKNCIFMLVRNRVKVAIGLDCDGFLN